MRKNVDKLVKATVAVVGDVKDNLVEVLKRDIKYNDRHEWFSKIDTWKTQFPYYYNRDPHPGELLKPQARALCAETPLVWF